MSATTRRVLPVAAAIVGLVLALTGCTPSDPKPTPTRTASSPIFSSDAEALKAATDAYAAYLKMSDTIAHDGGANPERIKEFVTASWSEIEVEAFRTLEDRGYHQEGWTKIQSSRLQSRSNKTVKIYACTDFTATNFEASDGTRVDPKGPRIAGTVLNFSVSSVSLLRLAKNEPWSGASFC